MIDTYHFNAAPVQALVYTEETTAQTLKEFLGERVSMEGVCKVRTNHRGWIALTENDILVKVSIRLELSYTDVIVDVVSSDYFYSHFTPSCAVFMQPTHKE